MNQNHQDSFDFPSSAPCANPVFYRTYSRRDGGTRESWDETCDRSLRGLIELGEFTIEQASLVERMQRELKALPSGRWLWVGGTEWLKKPENFYGAFNCSSSNVVDWKAFGLMMDLAMQGCGTGAVLEQKYINQLPAIRNKLNVSVIADIGKKPTGGRQEKTTIVPKENASKPTLTLTVGDSRNGWVQSYQILLEISSHEFNFTELNVEVDLSNVRPSGEKLQGFGGTANPIKLPGLYERCAKVLNKAIGRKLTAVECCLLIGEAALVVVAGNLRRSAMIHQSDSSDNEFATSKLNLWVQDEDGNWRIDPERDALRMANQTRVFHHKPTLDKCIEAVRSQYYSGEGAIQWAGEAVARASADLLDSEDKKKTFLRLYSANKNDAKTYLYSLSNELPDAIEHRMSRYGLNPCLRGDMRLLTSRGYKTFEELNDQKVEIINRSGDISQSAVWCSGERETVELKLTNKQSIFCTPDHRWMTVEGDEVEAQHLKGRKLMPFLKQPTHDKEKYVLFGFIQGDGSLGTLSRNGFKGFGISIGAKDGEIVELIDRLNLSYKWYGTRHIYTSTLSDEVVDLGFCLKSLPERILPLSYKDWSIEEKAAFLNGLYSANGSVICCGRVTLKTTCLVLAEQLIQTLEQDFGINAYYTTNQSKAIQFSNGTYQCRESYDVNIQQYQSRLTFFNQIGFSIGYKTEKLAEALIKDSPAVRIIKPGEVVKVYDFIEPLEHWGVVEGFVSHNCAEILLSDNFCNLSEVHLNQIDPFNLKEQEDAFTAAALAVAALLKRGFTEERYQRSRELDPIVGVSYTGLFDFFVNAFGVDWLRWWEAGRPVLWHPRGINLTLCYLTNCFPEEFEFGGDFYKEVERRYLRKWKEIVNHVVWEYCDHHNLKRPNRCTALQPAGTKSLLTGASSGWHPPKAQRFIRRITFGKNDPVALACIDYGYSVVPSQSDKDESGRLLDNPFDERCAEWLVEIPVEVPWANLPGADQIEISKFSALAQFDFWLNVQQSYTSHNSSATLELRENEIESLGARIYEAIQNDEGYISAALLARFDDKQTYPRLPFEPISKEEYERLSHEVLARRKTDSFHEALMKYDVGELSEAGPAGCDSDKCLFPQSK